MSITQPTMMDALRCTGRTTRMLRHAIERAAAGDRVIVVARKQDIIDRLRDRCVKLLAGGDGKFRLTGECICVGSGLGCGTIYFQSAGEPGWSWRDMQYRGVRSETLVDHAAIEAEFPELVEALHRFDSPGLCGLVANWMRMAGEWIAVAKDRR